mgnify:CR=1 FL=1
MSKLYIVKIHKTITKSYIVEEESGNCDLAEYRAIHEPDTCEGPAVSEDILVTTKEVANDNA